LADAYVWQQYIFDYINLKRFSLDKPVEACIPKHLGTSESTSKKPHSFVCMAAWEHPAYDITSVPLPRLLGTVVQILSKVRSNYLNRFCIRSVREQSNGFFEYGVREHLRAAPLSNASARGFSLYKSIPLRLLRRQILKKYNLAHRLVYSLSGRPIAIMLTNVVNQLKK